VARMQNTAYALELDSMLCAELRKASADFEEGWRGTRAVTTGELADYTETAIDLVRYRLQMMTAAGQAVEHRPGDSWTIAGVA
jgi:hypothetical protein